MLFNSYQFLFIFFPGVLIIYFALARFGEVTRLTILFAASQFFYAWWDIRFCLLLLGSIATNYLIGTWLSSLVSTQNYRVAGRLVIAGVALNLTVLGIFKYAYFFAKNLNAVFGMEFTLGTIILPLGISFFTFEQIGYLVDIYRGHNYKADLLRYAVFVSFFPRLVAGPILRYSEILPQLIESPTSRPRLDDLAVGLTIFSLGLVKKSVLADGIAPYATLAFQTAAAGKPLDLFIAWGGALSYTCQLYFDFSGYSDMAIGAARCFGLRFPMNFFSPYKAASIIDFWRRWHITLSRFLRDYLYISLGGNRHGVVRRYLNLFITMLLGGLWHGANWTFVAWGGLHGLYLIINHAWRGLVGTQTDSRSVVATGAGSLVTFLAVVVAWVFFRAPDIESALSILRAMAGANGATLPNGLEFALRPLHPLLAALGIALTDQSGTQLIKTYLWAGTLLTFAVVLPSTQELMARYHPVLESSEVERSTRALRRPLSRLRWSMSAGWAIASGAIAFAGLVSITRVSEFLYWQF